MKIEKRKIYAPYVKINEERITFNRYAVSCHYIDNFYNT